MNKEKLLELEQTKEDLSPITQRFIDYISNICRIEKQKNELNRELKENLVLLSVDCQKYLESFK